MKSEKLPPKEKHEGKGLLREVHAVQKGCIKHVGHTRFVAHEKVCSLNETVEGEKVPKYDFVLVRGHIGFNFPHDLLLD